MTPSPLTRALGHAKVSVMGAIQRLARAVVVVVGVMAIGLITLAGMGSGTAFGAPPLQGGAETPTPTPPRLPPNQPSRGLIYDGLEPGNAIVCPGAFKLRGSSHCTPGPDPAPSGVNIQSMAAPVTRSNAPAIQCDGDGTSGYRTQAMYVRPSDHSDQYEVYLASFRQWAEDADQIYLDSAAETGGYRRLRYVHDASCNLSVLNVVIPGTGNVDFSTMVSQLTALGYNRSDRKYMIFMDAALYCGIASLNGDDSPGQTNWNNVGPDYARADYGCWTGGIIAHESMHNMGAVQHSAPHSTYLQNQTSYNTWHCSDEYDNMCYPDAEGVVMTYPCSDSSHERIFDCNHDDYYHTNPAPDSYLATHWNSANNLFLISVPIPPGPFRNFLPIIVK